MRYYASLMIQRIPGNEHIWIIFVIPWKNRGGSTIFRPQFNDEKLRQVIKSYGFNVVPKCLSFPTSEGVATRETMEKSMKKNVEKAVDTPLGFDKLGHTDTESTALMVENSLCNHRPIESKA